MRRVEAASASEAGGAQLLADDVQPVGHALGGGGDVIGGAGDAGDDGDDAATTRDGSTENSEGGADGGVGTADGGVVPGGGSLPTPLQPSEAPKRDSLNIKGKEGIEGLLYGE